MSHRQGRGMAKKWSVVKNSEKSEIHGGTEGEPATFKFR